MASDDTRLLVRIEAQMRQFERAMKQATNTSERTAKKIQRDFSGLERNLAGVGRTLASSFGAGIIAGGLATLPSVIREVVRSVADLGDTADKIGLTTDALQELEFAARQSGIGTEDLDTALTKFSRGLGEAAAGSGKLLEVFQANGIAIKDASGNLLPLTTLLAKYADLIKNARSDQDRLNLSVIGFGKGGAAMVNLTRDGAAGLAELQQQARDAGAVIDSDLVNTARRLDDELQRLSDKFSVLAKSEILRFLQDLSHTMDVFGDATAFVADKFETLTSAAQSLSGVHLPEWLGVVEQSAGNLLHPIDAVTKSIETLTNKAKELFPLSPNARIDQAFSDAAKQGKIPRITIHPQPLTNQPSPTRNAAASAARKQADTVAELIKELQREEALVGATDTQRRISNELRRAGASATEEQKAQIAALVTQIEQEEAAQDKLIDVLDGVRNASGSALDAFAQSIQDGEGAAAGLKAALVDVLQTIIRIGEQQAIASLFGGFGTGGGGILGGVIGGLFGKATTASIPTLASKAAAQPAVVQLQVVEGKLFEPRVAAISGAVAVQHIRGVEDRAIARGPSVARDNQRRFGTG